MTVAPSQFKRRMGNVQKELSGGFSKLSLSPQSFRSRASPSTPPKQISRLPYNNFNIKDSGSNLNIYLNHDAPINIEITP